MTHNALKELVANMDLATYEKLREAVELGRWADGTPLTAEQQENTMQLVIAYQALRLDQQQHMQVGKDGALILKSKAQLKQQYRSDDASDIARFRDADANGKFH